MATAAVIELPAFLEHESIDYDIKQQVEKVLSKYQMTLNDVPENVKDKVNPTIVSSIEKSLEDKSIRWNFGDRTAFFMNPTQDDVKDAEQLTSRVVDIIDNAVGTTIFLTTSALGFLAAGGFKSSKAQ